MGFQHPHQQQHKLSGMAKAAHSPNTPAHLREHLAKRVNMARVTNVLRQPSGKVPKQNILRETTPADVSEQEPMDKASFQTQPGANDVSATSKMGKSTIMPRPAGSRPLNVGVVRPKAKGPGIVASQGAVSHAKPSAAGLNQTLGAVVRPNSSRTGPGLQKSFTAVRKGERGPGIQKTASVKKTRNMRPGAPANSNFYGEF